MQLEDHIYIFKYSKDKNFPDMITLQFCRDESVKPVESFLVINLKINQNQKIIDFLNLKIGVSPEFEVALYTILFLFGTENTKLNFANMSIAFHCFKLQRNGKSVLATVYPAKN